MNRKRLNKVPDEVRRSLFVAVLVFIGFCSVLVNQIRVQSLQRESIFATADELGRMLQTETLAARRGDIYASDGRLVATSSSRYKVGLRPASTSLSPAMAYELSAASGLPASEFLDYVSRGKFADDWDVHLDREQAARVERVRAKYGADSVWTAPAKEREYPLAEYMAPVLGIVQNGIGRTGVEKWLDAELRGREGTAVGVKDADGRFLPWLMRKTNSQPAIDGDDVTLTIDTDLQIAAMDSLMRQTAAHKADHGISIVMDVETGDILALATTPTYDPSDPARAFAEFAAGRRSSPEINPAISFMFEPGSTFKLFTVAIGLESGVIQENETVQCAGSKQFSVKTMSCAGDHEPKKHGTVNAAKCIEVSCNIAAATWGVRIGFDAFAQRVEALGLLEKPGIGISPEARGSLRKDDGNRTIQMANVGFGQSINSTPLGLVSAFACFGNGGYRVGPRLVKDIGGRPTPPAPRTRVFQQQTADRILSMMEAVVQSPGGTGYSLRIPGYTLAGKTGTAQKRDPKTGLVRSGMYISSFVGYFPAKQPRAVILVMLDNPKSGQYYGARVAGPVFRDIVQFLIRKWKVPPDRPTEASIVAE